MIAAPEVQPRFDLKTVLRDIYAADGTVIVTGLWDASGWSVRIQDNRAGSEAERTFSNAALDFDILASWLARTFSDLHPTSDFARKYDCSAQRPKADAAPGIPDLQTNR